MNTNLNNIYDDYRKADFTDRLHMYLQFRELREDFFEIEQEKTDTDYFFSYNRHPG